MQLLLEVPRLRQVVFQGGIPPLSVGTLGVVGLHFGSRLRRLLLHRNRVRFRCWARLCRAAEFFRHWGPGVGNSFWCCRHIWVPGPRRWRCQVRHSGLCESVCDPRRARRGQRTRLRDCCLTMTRVRPRASLSSRKRRPPVLSKQCVVNWETVMSADTLTYRPQWVKRSWMNIEPSAPTKSPVGLRSGQREKQVTARLTFSRGTWTGRLVVEGRVSRESVRSPRAAAAAVCTKSRERPPGKCKPLRWQ